MVREGSVIIINMYYTLHIYSTTNVLKILPRNGVAVSRDYNILSITFQSVDRLTEGIDYSNSSQIVFAGLRSCGSHMYYKGQFKKFLDSLHNYLAINIVITTDYILLVWYFAIFALNAFRTEAT